MVYTINKDKQVQTKRGVSIRTRYAQKLPIHQSRKLLYYYRILQPKLQRKEYIDMANKQKKRADGRIQTSFMFKGHRYYVYGYDKQEVERKKYERMQELEKGVLDHSNPMMDSYYENWAANRNGIVKEATLRTQEHFYNTIKGLNISGVRFGEYRLSEVKADDIRALQKELLSSGNSEQTVNDKIAFISHMFHDAVKERYIDYNPCSPVKPLKRTNPRARDTIHRALTLEEQREFFEAAKKSNYYNVYRFAILTGMRIGEIGALYISDISNNMIHVERTITRTQSGSYVIGDDTKTWNGKRTIPLNDDIKAVIENQKAINKILDNGKVMSMHDTLFKAVDRGLLMATPLDRDLGRICKRIGIEHFTCHAFRATFATRCIEANMPVRTIQELLGHADYSLTMNLYGHVTDDTKERAMNDLHIAI